MFVDLPEIWVPVVVLGLLTMSAPGLAVAGIAVSFGRMRLAIAAIPVSLVTGYATFAVFQVAFGYELQLTNFALGIIAATLASMVVGMRLRAPG
jgi:predicted membrane protein